jgi:uncharacterized protein
VSLYVDTSALLKRYVQEPDSERCERYLTADSRWLTARHTKVEVRRNLARILSGEALAAAQAAFELDWARALIVELDETTCDHAVFVAESTGARTLDALHLAAAHRLGGEVAFLTFDHRQAQAARRLGMVVLGV